MEGGAKQKKPNCELNLNVQFILRGRTSVVQLSPSENPKIMICYSLPEKTWYLVPNDVKKVKILFVGKTEQTNSSLLSAV